MLHSFTKCRRLKLVSRDVQRRAVTPVARQRMVLKDAILADIRARSGAFACLPAQKIFGSGSPAKRAAGDHARREPYQARAIPCCVFVHTAALFMRKNVGV